MKTSKNSRKCLADCWTVFSEWLSTLSTTRVVPNEKIFLIGWTLEKLYAFPGKDFKKGSYERVRKRVLRNKKLKFEMAYFLQSVKSLSLKPKQIKTLTVRFWIKTEYCPAHWWLMFQHISTNWSYYSKKNVESFISIEFKEKVKTLRQWLQQNS